MATRRAAATHTHDETPEPGATLSGTWLLLARLGWCVTALLSLGFVIGGLPDLFSELTPLWFTNNSAPGVDIPSAVIQEGLDQLGIPPRVYAAYGLALYVARAVVFFAAGTLLFWRKSTERMALLVAVFLVALPGGDTDPRVLHAMFDDAPLRAAMGTAVETVGFTLVLWLFFLFPMGVSGPAGRTRRPAAGCWWAWVRSCCPADRSICKRGRAYSRSPSSRLRRCWRS